MTLQFGIFLNFGGRDTLLIWGEKPEIAKLRDAFRDFAATKLSALSLNDLPWAQSVRGTRIHMALDEDRESKLIVDEDGLMRLAASPEEFAEFADKLDNLMSPSCGSGHQYLDQLGRSGIQVVVSIGEYPPNFRSEAS